MLNMNENLDLT